MLWEISIIFLIYSYYYFYFKSNLALNIYAYMQKGFISKHLL